MKLTYLGTAAAEGFPGVFCNCEYCIQARKTGGKNIRTRSQSLINDDLLIDLPADTYSHFLANGIEGHKINYLLVTHSHSDHFYPDELEMRQGCYAHNMKHQVLEMYCGKGVKERFDYMNKKTENIDISVVNLYEEIKFGKYTVYPLRARHYEGDGALFYIIQADGKTLLYAHDTGYFYDEVFELIKEKGFKFDLISYDCTNVDIAIGDDGTHMGIENIERVDAKLAQMGATHENTIRVINHFSHNACPLHDVLENRVKELGYLVSYDGMKIDF